MAFLIGICLFTCILIVYMYYDAKYGSAIQAFPDHNNTKKSLNRITYTCEQCNMKYAHYTYADNINNCGTCNYSVKGL